MRLIVDNAPHVFGPWMAEKVEGMRWLPGEGQYIGLFDTALNRPIASCMFTAFNGKSCVVHLASDGSRRWLTRDYLWFCFYYPFVQLGAWKLIAPIESSNDDSIRWTKHCGYELEATLKDASPKGDLLLFTMTKEQCKWLSLKDQHEQTASARAA